jgi:hypothetical protein
MVVRVSAILVGVLLSTIVRDAFGEGFRYIDSSGNIHFVDSLGQVPRQYREQLIPPTPTVALDERTRRKLEREREREAAVKQKDAERKKRQLEKERERQRRMAEKQAGKDQKNARPPVNRPSAEGESQMEEVR